jgi:hypothetical protein
MCWRYEVSNLGRAETRHQVGNDEGTSITIRTGWLVTLSRTGLHEGAADTTELHDASSTLQTMRVPQACAISAQKKCDATVGR